MPTSNDSRLVRAAHPTFCDTFCRGKTFYLLILLLFDLCNFLDDHLGLPDRGCIDQTAIQAHRPSAFRRRLLHRFDNATGTLDLLLTWRVDLIGQFNLGWVDRPLALPAQRGKSPRHCKKSLWITEIPERTIDGPQTVGPTGHNHA